MGPAVRLRREPVHRIMRRRWISLAPELAVGEALSLMRMARVRTLPVSTDGILLGVVSFPALVAAALRGAPERVAEVMTDEAETAEQATPLVEAAARLARGRTGCLPVVKRTRRGPRLVGLVTEGDLLQLAYLSPVGSVRS